MKIIKPVSSASALHARSRLSAAGDAKTVGLQNDDGFAPPQSPQAPDECNRQSKDTVGSRSQDESDDAQFDISTLPNWTPDTVKKAIENLERMNLTINYRPILKRLAFDVRMEKVWQELQKRKESGEFLHPVQARKEPNSPASDGEQSGALSELFLYVLIAAYEQYPVAKPDEIIAVQNNSLAHATVLRAVANDMALALETGQLGLTDDLESKQLADGDRLALLRVANWLENTTRALRRLDDPLVVERDRGDRVERGVHISIANKLLWLFGKRLGNTAATLTSVALGVKIGVRPARSALASKDGSSRIKRAG